MIELTKNGAYLLNGRDLIPEENKALGEQKLGRKLDREEGRKGTIAWGILQDHNTSGSPDHLKIRYDALTSHDLTYVGIIQTARASGMDHFPMPMCSPAATIPCAPWEAPSTRTTISSASPPPRNTGASSYRPMWP